MNEEKKIHQSSYAITSEYWLSMPSKPKAVYLLLHGFSQRGESIFRKLKSILPKDAVVISPNAPFPSPVKINDEYKEAYAWYFYLSKEKRFVIPPQEAANALQHLIASLHVQNLPLHIIGFSQGGYMGAWMVKQMATVRSVISIAADYPNHYYDNLREYKFDIIHGLEDKVAPIEEVRKNVEMLKQKGRRLEFHELPDTAHEINDSVIAMVKKILN